MDDIRWSSDSQTREPSSLRQFELRRQLASCEMSEEQHTMSRACSKVAFISRIGRTSWVWSSDRVTSCVGRVDRNSRERTVWYRQRACTILALCWLAGSTTEGVAAPGDVSFRAADANLTVSDVALQTTLDVYLDIESLESITANGWSLSAQIIPGPGSTGQIAFDVEPISDNLPNLPGASQNPFTDFDREQQGRSYGAIGDSPAELFAFAPYVPYAADPADEDPFGNITVPSGAGLVSLPLLIEPGTEGDFLVSLEHVPFVTGVSLATGNDPGDVSLHPNADNQPGAIRVSDSPFAACDVNRDLSCDAADIDLLSEKIRTGQTEDLSFDLNGDGVVSSPDRDHWVEVLMNTYFGDSNLDLAFDTVDMVDVFVAGEYEDQQTANSTWATGDWDGDAEFATTDMVLAFQKGGYEIGPRSEAHAVPEPASWMALIWGSALFLVDRHRRSRSTRRLTAWRWGG